MVLGEKLRGEAPIVGAERVFLERLSQMLNGLPPGKATLHIGRTAAPDQGSLFPFFKVQPVNVKAAEIRGVVYDQLGIDFTVGLATHQEWHLGSVDAKASSRINRLLEIFYAVFTSRFTETVTYDSSEKPIRGWMALDVHGNHIRLGRSAIVLWPIRIGKFTKTITYEPY